MSTWPRRRAYPLAGLLLAAGMPLGLFTIHAVLDRFARHAQSPALPQWSAWIGTELVSRPLTYAYLLLSSATILVILGWVIGRKEDALEALSVTDAMTGLANRRRFGQAMEEEVNRAVRYGTPVALLLVDLDRLKELNDREGHAAGDRALQLVAESLRHCCRATDVAARLGGDEFAVLAPSTTASEALALADRVRAVLADLATAIRGQTRPLTVSIGTADLEGALAPTIEALSAAADRALYQAKAEGRDCAVAVPSRSRSMRSSPRLRLV